MSLRSRLQMFVLTRQEQRTIAFIVLAVILGLATQHYRRQHSERLEAGPSDLGQAGPVGAPGSSSRRRPTSSFTRSRRRGVVTVSGWRGSRTPS